MADVVSRTLTPLFRGLPRQLEVEAATVTTRSTSSSDAGRGSATGSASPGRRSGRTSTSTSTGSARELETPLEPRSAST